MSDFNLAIKVPLYFEGGYVNDPEDPGGETNWGISKRSYPQLDIHGLTLEHAKEIYLQDFWMKYHIDFIHDSVLATKILDQAINLGPDAAIKMVQMQYNYVYYEKIAVDGIIGPITASKLNMGYAELITEQLRYAGKAYHLNLIKKRPVDIKYKKGWLRRDGWPYLAGRAWPFLPREGEYWQDGD